MTDFSAEWYKSALDAMRDMVLIKGPRSHLLWANKAFRDYYGMSEDDLRDVIDADHSDPDDTLQYVIDDQRVFDTGTDLDVPAEAVTDAKGTVREFHTIKSPILEGPAVVRTVGVSRMCDDVGIGKRRIEHRDAKEFTAPLRHLTANFPAPMLMVDIKQRIVVCSPLWAAAFGPRAPSPNAFLQDTYPALDALTETVGACIEAGDHRETVLELDSPGQSRIFSVRVSSWAFPSGEIGGATILASDITELHTKTRRLERANDELTQFSYRASHDLKGPISSAKGLASFIVNDITDGEFEEAKTSAVKIIDSMTVLEETVMSILALARADLKREAACDVDLSLLIDEICGGLVSEIDGSGVAIQRDLQVPKVRLEVARLRQILTNLISNAVKYRAAGRTDCFVRLSSRQTGDGYVFEVADNGLGLPEGARDRVFDLFQRFHARIEGSGLGLAIVKKHVDHLGGEIRVADRPEGGTIFTVFIPARAQRNAA